MDSCQTAINFMFLLTFLRKMLKSVTEALFKRINLEMLFWKMVKSDI